MQRNLLVVLTVLVLAAIGGSPVMADTFTQSAQFTFNVDYCSNPCLGGVPASNNGGTVTLYTDTNNANIVEVVVRLAAGLIFHDQGLDSFLFDVTNNPTLTLNTGAFSTLANDQVQLDTTLTTAGSWSFSTQPPSNLNGDGAGQDFRNAWDCVGGANGCTGSPTVLAFFVDVTGITTASLETLTGEDSHGTVGNNNVDFAANVAQTAVGGCTGMIGAGNNTAQSTAATANSTSSQCTSPNTTVPEPTSVLLLGTVLAFVGKFLKGRLAAA